ncbi:hypothetical protein GCM10010289_54900 [Streptomyces violascens]|uniref:Uncharacterized protein n=2 Tax=Streptomyces violascens TaxID=67381 RepID=A0ABQ3QVC9_9ACTN|nr:hypothetical protein GCM10010289_54900 [Streptomyces violascens]GHI41227.1 hypothetical protein Sviol_56350 [Streptomyces violascens]
MEVFWAAGYDRTTYRTVYDLKGGSVECSALIDTLRADGQLILLPSTQWRRILGDFNTTRVHKQRGHYWYATRDQHTRWTQSDRDRDNRIATIGARLKAAALPPLHVRNTTWTDGGSLVHDTHPDAQHCALELCTPDEDRVAEVTCNYSPTDTDSPTSALAGAKASAELFAHAPTDIAYLLSLLTTEGHT